MRQALVPGGQAINSQSMDWRDTGILLAVRRHGETSAILDVFTKDHGRHAGVLRGASSRKIAAALQPGSDLDVIWRARLEEHIGAFTIEPLKTRAGMAMTNRLTLAGLNSVVSLLSFSLPEREQNLRLFNDTGVLLDLLDRPDIWPLAYLKWEMALLEELGYGLDLSACAATGRNDELIYVSPRSGRAVSRHGAGDWADRMLPLPPILQGKGDAPDSEVAIALKTTGYFLEQKLAPALGSKPLPSARAAFCDRLQRQVDMAAQDRLEPE